MLAGKDKALLVISDLEPDDLIAIKALWLSKAHLTACGYTAIYVVICGNADAAKCIWLADNIAPESWTGLECTYFMGTVAKPEINSSFLCWSSHVDERVALIQDVLVLAPCEDLLPVVNHQNCQIRTIFNQGGGAPATGKVTFNWANVEATQEMFAAVKGISGCCYYLVNSEFVKSEAEAYPYKGGSLHGENAKVLHPVLMQDDRIRDTINKWNNAAKSNPNLPAQVRALLDMPLQFTPADVLVAYAFLAHTGLWLDPDMQWTQCSGIEVDGERKVTYVQASSELPGKFNIIKGMDFGMFEINLAKLFSHK